MGGLRAALSFWSRTMAETTDELLARMAAKYGLPNSSTQQPPQPAQPVAPQPVPEPPKRGLIDMLRGRTQQIDQAVDKATRGYAKGGKICGMAHGGKIQGPGTPTSDSIPAQVEESGEPIRVSTGERILSKAQDGYLSAMAKKMGFDSLDAMLEHGTGQPVGPTVKGGQRAAANGALLDDWNKRRDALTAEQPISVTPASENGPWRNPNIRGLRDALTDNGRFFNFGGAPQNPNYGNEGRGNYTAQTQIAPPSNPSPQAQPNLGLTDALPPGIAMGVLNGRASYSGTGAGGGGTGRDVMDIYKNASDIQAQQIEQPTQAGIIRNTQTDDRRAFDNFVNRTTLQSAINEAITQNTPRSLASIANLENAQTALAGQIPRQELDRKSTRLNS